MPYDVREAKAAATSAGSTDRVHPSVQAALDDFDANTTYTSIDQVDVERIGRNRVVVTILYTS